MFKNYSVPTPTFDSEYEAFTYGETLVTQLEEASAANLVRLYNTIRLHVTCTDKSQLGLNLYDPTRKTWVREGLTESFKAPSGQTPKLLEVDASRHPVFGAIR